jgi:preprotein translocase subunit SecG
MYGLLLALHILVCLALILTILLQSGKGGGLAGGAFGGTAQTVFGGRGATDVLTKATMVLGGAFFVTSLVLALMSSGTRGVPSRSLIQEEAKRAIPTAPQQGGAPGQQQAPAPGQQQPPAQGAPPAGGQPPAGGTQPAPTTAPPGGR